MRERKAGVSFLSHPGQYGRRPTVISWARNAGPCFQHARNPALSCNDLSATKTPLTAKDASSKENFPNSSANRFPTDPSEDATTYLLPKLMKSLAPDYALHPANVPIRTSCNHLSSVKMKVQMAMPLYSSTIFHLQDSAGANMLSALKFCHL